MDNDYIEQPANSSASVTPTSFPNLDHILTPDLVIKIQTLLTNYQDTQPNKQLPEFLEYFNAMLAKSKNIGRLFELDTTPIKLKSQLQQRIIEAADSFLKTIKILSPASDILLSYTEDSIQNAATALKDTPSLQALNKQFTDFFAWCEKQSDNVFTDGLKKNLCHHINAGFTFNIARIFKNKETQIFGQFIERVGQFLTFDPPYQQKLIDYCRASPKFPTNHEAFLINYDVNNIHIYTANVDTVLEKLETNKDFLLIPLDKQHEIVHEVKKSFTSKIQTICSQKELQNTKNVIKIDIAKMSTLNKIGVLLKKIIQKGLPQKTTYPQADKALEEYKSNVTKFKPWQNASFARNPDSDKGPKDFLSGNQKTTVNKNLDSKKFNTLQPQKSPTMGKKSRRPAISISNYNPPSPTTSVSTTSTPMTLVTTTTTNYPYNTTNSYTAYSSSSGQELRLQPSNNDTSNTSSSAITPRRSKRQSLWLATERSPRQSSFIDRLLPVIKSTLEDDEFKNKFLDSDEYASLKNLIIEIENTYSAYDKFKNQLSKSDENTLDFLQGCSLNFEIDYTAEILFLTKKGQEFINNIKNAINILYTENASEMHMLLDEHYKALSLQFDKMLVQFCPAVIDLVNDFPDVDEDSASSMDSSSATFTTDNEYIYLSEYQSPSSKSISTSTPSTPDQAQVSSSEFTTDNRYNLWYHPPSSSTTTTSTTTPSTPDHAQQITQTTQTAVKNNSTGEDPRNQTRMNY